MIRGQPKMDGLSVGELTLKFYGTALEFQAKAAFVNSETGQTHGWTTNSNWSPETLAKVKELVDSMESDLARIHLDHAGHTQAAPGVPAATGGMRVEGGLGEHLGGGGDGIPSV